MLGFWTQQGEYMAEKTEKGYRVEYVALAEVVRWPRNPKKHDEKALDASLERFGFTEPLVLDEKSGKLVAGHGRLEALQRWQTASKAPPKNIATKGKEWLVPVVRGISFKDEREAEAYLIASNRISEIGGWDEASLSKMLEDLSSSSNLEGTGYEIGDVESMIRQVAAAQAPVVGKSPDELLPGFLNAEIKQIVLYFDSAQYDSVVERLAAVQAATGVASNTEVFLKLLEYWEASHGASNGAELPVGAPRAPAASESRS